MKQIIQVKSTILLLCFCATSAWADTAITSLPYTISTPGAYYLTSDHTVTDNSYGIFVGADNVTIDLKGYSITGANAANSIGILIGGYNTVVKNGAVKNFYDGINDGGSSAGSSYTKISNVSVTGNSFGIRINGIGAWIEKCSASENVTGIAVTTGASVLHNKAINNTGAGIYTSVGATLIGNTTILNGTYGITAGDGSNVSKNTSYQNGSDGLRCGYGCTIIGNTAYDNQGNGIFPNAGSTVKNNTAYSNTGYGIYFGPNSYNVFDGNTTHQNGVNPDFNTCTTCKIGVNLP